MKGKISADLLQKLKASVNILEVVGEHVVLRKAGANFVGLCPFHSERSPSFSVSETKQLYHCYGCKKGGDLLTFVMEVMGISFPEAVEDLADRAKVSLPSNWEGVSSVGREQDAARREKVALAFKLNRFAGSYFHQNLLNQSGVSQSVGQNYFRTRGVGDHWIKSFYLGLASDSWHSLAEHLASKKAPLDMAAELGLIRASSKGKGSDSVRGGGHFDLFRNRAIFPIVNLRGKIAGFGGRFLASDSNLDSEGNRPSGQSKETPKYLNSPDSLIYQKGKLAFGLFQAQKYIREQDELILVEGYFDVLALHAAGFRNVAATCGTAITTDHLKLFKRLTSKIILLFDGDEAGQAATVRAMELGLDQGQVFYGAQLPKGMDPDEFVLQSDGASQMTELLKDAKPLLDDGIEDALRSARRSPEERVQALKKMGGWLGRFRDPVGREVRLQWIEKRLGVSRGLIDEALGAVENPSHSQSQSSPQSQASDVKKGEIIKFRSSSSRSSTRICSTDRILFGGLVFGGEYSQAFRDIKEQLPPGMGLHQVVSHPLLQEFVDHLLSQAGFLERLRLNPDSLIENELDNQVRSILTESLLWSEAPFPVADFRGAALKSTARLWARFSQRIKEELSEAEISKDLNLQVQLMKDYLDVQRKMKEFSSFYDQE